MFLNIIALLGLALSSQGNLNEISTTVHAAESGYTFNYGEPVDYTYGKSPEEPYSFDYGDPEDSGEPYRYEYSVDYEFDASFGGLVIGYADLIGFAFGLLIGVALLARRLETGAWPVPRYVRSLVIPTALIAAGFGVAVLEGLPVLESLLGFTGPSWGRGIALAATIAYDAVYIGAELVLPKSRPPANG